MRAALDAGADVAVAGTRFLLSEESRAHALYKERLLAAEETLLTDLFGAAWPAPHRVVPNAATDHFLGRRSSFLAQTANKDERRELQRGPRLNRALNHLLAPGARYAPPGLQMRMIQAQRPDSRLLSPAGPSDDVPETLVDAGALYSGETVARIDDVRAAGDLVRELAP